MCLCASLSPLFSLHHSIIQTATYCNTNLFASRNLSVSKKNQRRPRFAHLHIGQQHFVCDIICLQAFELMATWRCFHWPVVVSFIYRGMPSCLKIICVYTTELTAGETWWTGGTTPTQYKTVLVENALILGPNKTQATTQREKQKRYFVPLFYFKF